MDVLGNASITGNVVFGYDTNLNGNITIGKDITALGRLNVQNFTTQNIINTTTNNYQLIVSEDLSLNGKMFAKGNVMIGSGNEASYLLDVSSVSSAPFRVGVGAVNAIAVNSAGLVGIGSASPTVALDVNGAVYSTNATTGNIIVLNTGMPVGRKGMWLNYSNDGYGQIQVEHQGTGYKNLSLNTNGGYVGIGITNPTTPLEVVGVVTVTGTGSFFVNGVNNFNNIAMTRSVSIKAAGAIWSGDGFFATSDMRIKKNIRNFDALDLLHKLKPVLFTYIENNNNEYGFIAQEIDSNLLQHTVTIAKSYIPNIFEKADISKNIITLLDKTTNVFEYDASNNLFTKLKCYDSSNNEIIVNITSILDDKSFEIDNPLKTDKIFIYGQEVNNFCSMKKDEIVTINTKAIQEQQQIIETLQTENLELKTQLTSILSRLSALENK